MMLKVMLDALAEQADRVLAIQRNCIFVPLELFSRVIVALNFCFNFSCAQLTQLVLCEIKEKI